MTSSPTNLSGFTLEEGMLVQNEQMERWQNILSAKAYAHLDEVRRQKNLELQQEGIADPSVLNGYHVWRGIDIAEFITMDLIYIRL